MMHLLQINDICFVKLSIATSDKLNKKKEPMINLLNGSINGSPAMNKGSCCIRHWLEMQVSENCGDP